MPVKIWGQLVERSRDVIAFPSGQIVTDIDGPLQGGRYVLADRLRDVVKLYRDEHIEKYIDITRGKRLGRGCFGTVRICTDLESQEQRAVKVMNKRDVFQQNPWKVQKRSLFIEAAACLKTGILPPHENIIKVHQYYETPTYIYIVMELLRKSNLSRLMGSYDCNQARRMFYKVLGAVKHFHDHGLVHCDLKLTNICLRMDTNEPVLIDLGNATFREGDEVRRRLFETQKLFSKGELEHVMPVDEDLSGLRDILESLLTGNEDITERAFQGDPYPPKADTHPEALNLLNLLSNPQRRETLTTDDLLIHSWFQNMP